VIASVGDASLRHSDALLLNDGLWLNDAVIAFAFEVLSSALPDHVLLLAPSVAHLIATVDRDFAASIARPLNLHARQVVFLPVNDCVDLDEPGGSHWSLLVFSRAHNEGFFYYDSLNNFNLEAAKRMKDKFLPLLCPSHAPHSPQTIISNIRTAPSVVFFQQMDMQSQTNGYDCGVYVIAVTELL
ncbi:hypothetical protein BC830DRAFT_1045850, partial [Chytriomyces sp. MP71]